MSRSRSRSDSMHPAIEEWKEGWNPGSSMSVGSNSAVAPEGSIGLSSETSEGSMLNLPFFLEVTFGWSMMSEGSPEVSELELEEYPFCDEGSELCDLALGGVRVLNWI